MSGPHKWRYRFQQQVTRWTIPREAILALLSRTSKHMSAKEIYYALSAVYPGIGLSTIYRTLELLVRAGFLNQIFIGDGQSRYEFQTAEKDKHHYHLICNKCGKIIDYNDFLEEKLEFVKKAEEKAAGKYNFLVQGHNIDFFGLCKDCQQ